MFPFKAIILLFVLLHNIIKTMMLKSQILFLLSACVLIFSSCGKPDEPMLWDDRVYIESSAPAALAAQSFSDIGDIANELQAGGLGKFANTCSRLTYDTLGEFKKIQVSFGGCRCADGKIRRGRINVAWNGNYFEVGNKIDIITENYFVEGHKFEVVREVENLDTIESGFHQYKIREFGTYTRPKDNAKFDLHTHHIRTWTAGFATPTHRDDDEWLVTGSSRFLDRNGNELFISIVDSIELKGNCPYIREGRLEMILGINKAQIAILDYGQGLCDNLAHLLLADGRVIKVWIK